MEQEQQRIYKTPKYTDEYIETGMGLDYDDSTNQYSQEEQHLNHLETEQQQTLIKGEGPTEDDEDDTIINVDDDLKSE